MNLVGELGELVVATETEAPRYAKLEPEFACGAKRGLQKLDECRVSMSIAALDDVRSYRDRGAAHLRDQAKALLAGSSPSLDT